MALGFWNPNADPNVDMDTRRKIAVAMLAQNKRAYPKTFGEGLASIGDSISDAYVMRQLLEQNAEENKAADAFKGKYTGITPPTAQTGAENVPPDSMPLDVTAASVAPSTPPIVPAAPSRPRTVMPAPIPPPNGQLGNRGDTVFPTQANGLVQPQPSPPPLPAQAAAPPTTAPVMAQGGNPAAVPPDEEARRVIGQALLRQQMGGAPAGPPRPSVADFGQPSALAATPPQAIPAAPPQPQVRAMPPPQVAQGPQIVDPGPEPLPGRTMTDLQRQILQDIDKQPPSRRAGAQRAVEPILQQEQAKLAQENAIVQRKHALWEARTKMRDEQTYGAPKNAAETAKILQEVEKGKEPTLREDVETKHIYNSATGQYEPAKIAGADPSQKPTFKGNEFQGKALVNYGRAAIAHEGLAQKGKDGVSPEDVLAGSWLQSTLSTVPGVSGITRPMRSDIYKEAETHADNFVQAFIRQQSGGAYGPAELESEARGMLPKYGDTEKQLQAKREQREQFLSGMHSIIGPSGQKGTDFDAAKRAAERERSLAAEKKPADKVYEFANEAEAAKANLPKGTPVIVGGRRGRVQ